MAFIIFTSVPGIAFAFTPILFCYGVLVKRVFAFTPTILFYMDPARGLCNDTRGLIELRAIAVIETPKQTATGARQM